MTQWGVNADHFNIDDYPQVLNSIKAFVTGIAR